MTLSLLSIFLDLPESNKVESVLTSSSSVWSAIGGRLQTDFVVGVSIFSESVTDGRASGETPE